MTPLRGVLYTALTARYLVDTLFFPNISLAFQSHPPYTWPIMSHSMSPPAMKDFITHFLDSKKAQDIVTIDLRGKSSIADYLVIASGTSQRQIASMAQLLKEDLKKQGIKDIHIEGLTQCDWVLLDVGDVIVHLFRPEIRSFYNLEKMWSVELSEDATIVS